jgi:hypothetical protein
MFSATIYLLRTCPPSLTMHAAKRIDIAIANAIYYITDSARMLPNENSRHMQRLLNRLFLPIRFGGNGLICTEDTRDAAYVGSFLHCKSYILILYPELKTSQSDCIEELIQSIDRLKQLNIQAVRDITETNLWESYPKKKQQKTISLELYKKTQS